MEEIWNVILSEGIYLLRILLGGVCGLMLGIERSKRHKEAGRRTHFVVATASALLMVISLHFQGDEARIAAQIVSGVGFLGAGMIFFRRESLHGLTTAAGIWATAGIGMAAGAGLYVVALGASAIIVLGQTIFHTKRMAGKYAYHLILVKFTYSEETITLLKKYFNTDMFSRFKAYEDGEKVTAEAVISTLEPCSAQKLVKLMNACDDIYSVERLEDL